MVLNVTLDHLQEHEIKLIHAVLERDAEIQKRDDLRKRKLQRSIVGERIPQRRLSVKCRTGEWLHDITEPSRAPKKKGVEVVRASIKQKRYSKPPRVSAFENTDEEVVNTQDPAISRVDEPHTEEAAGVEETVKTNEVDISTTEKEQDTSQDVGFSRFYDKKDAEPTFKDEGTESKEGGKSVRRTSFRRKKLASNEKQVKFAPEKTEKYVYERASIDDENVEEKIDDIIKQNVPTIIIDDSSDYTTPDLEVESVEYKEAESAVPITDSKEDYVSYGDNVYTSSKTFESYHNTVGKEIFHNEETEDSTDVPEKEKYDKPGTVVPKVMKKVKVVKRKGSTRKRGSPKITDDSSRNTVFSRSEEEAVVTTEEKVEVIVTAAEVPEHKDDVTIEPEAYSSTEPAYVTETPVPIVIDDKDNYVPTTPTVSYDITEPSKPELEEQPTDDAIYIIPAAEIAITDNKLEDTYNKTYGEVKEDIQPLAEFEKKDEYSAPLIKDQEEVKEPETIYTKPDPVSSVEIIKEEEVAHVEPYPAPGDTQDVKKEIITASVDAYPTEEPAAQDDMSLAAEIEKTLAGYGVTPTKEEVVSVETPTPSDSSYVVQDNTAEETPINEGYAGETDKITSTEKPKKKVVKKIIKKKVKPAEGEETASQDGDDGNENKSKLHRTQTVRKKVVRRKPPPQAT